MRETPKYVPPPKYDIPENTPPLYDDRAELPPEPRRSKPSRPRDDQWSYNEQERDRRRLPDAEPRSMRRSVCSYKVQRGDTLSAIAEERYGNASHRTIDRIVAANPGMNPDRIYAGETILLPKSLTCSPPPVEPCPCKRPDREGYHSSDRSRPSYALQLIPISAEVKR